MIYSGSRRVNSEAAEHEYLSATVSLERPRDQKTILNEKLEAEREDLCGKRDFGAEGGVAVGAAPALRPHSPAQRRDRCLGFSIAAVPAPAFLFLFF